MVKKLLLGTVLGGLIVFAWGAISWMVLPWHTATLQAFTNEAVVSKVIQANAPQPGVYFLPNPRRQTTGAESTASAKSDKARMEEGPMVFGTIRLVGIRPDSPTYYLKGLLMEMIGAFFMSWLLLTLPGLGYGARLRTITLVALTAGALTYLPDWHWWGFSAAYTAIKVLDLVIGWFLAGLVMARVARPE